MMHKSASVMTSKLPHLGKRVCLIMLWSILGVSLKFVEFEAQLGLMYSARSCSRVTPKLEASEASEEDHNVSQQVIHSRNSFKYKSSHPEDQIIGNKESPRRTRSHFRPEESALGLLSMIEPTKVDEALADDG